MSGGQDQPDPGRTTSKETSKSSTSATGATTGTSTTTPTLPPFMTEGLTQNFGGYLGNIDQFGNRLEDWTAAGFTPDQLQGFDLQRQAALGPQQSSIDELMRTAQGDYLYGGEGFNAAVDAAFRAGMPQVLSRFGAAGRDDGGLAQAALAKAFADPFAMQYGEERARQQAAQFGLPQLSLLPGQTFQDIGQQQQQLQQYAENYPLETLFPQLFEAQRGATSFAAPFLGSTGTTAGTSSQEAKSKSKGNVVGTTLPPTFPGSPLASGLGGALAGAGTGAQIGSLIPGIGTLLGAGAGGLLGGIAGFA